MKLIGINSFKYLKKAVYPISTI